MSTELRDACALGVTDEALSALRDEALAPNEASRLAAHVPTCPVCSERVARYEQVGALLRAQRLAGPSADLWEDVRAAVVSDRAPSVARGSRWAMRRPMWSGVGAIAAALAVALLFGLVLRSFQGVGDGATTLAPTATTIQATTRAPTAPATSTALPLLPPVPGMSPSWQGYTLPAGFTLDEPISALAVAPSDGNTAYVCQGGASPTGARVIVTHDRGASWTTRSDVAVGSACNLVVVDQIDPNIVLASSADQMFVTRDSGAAWAPATAQLAGIVSLATLGPRTFALGAFGTTSNRLEVSDDGMHTWRPVDDTIAGEVQSFWLDAANGHLLTATPRSFWMSDDDGSHWSQLSGLGGRPADYVARAARDGNWHICSLTQCTTDSGRTWAPIPPLVVNRTVVTPATGGRPLALTSDGSLLATVSVIDLYRLPVASTRWQALGAPPDPTYSPFASGSGVLWALPPGGKGAFNRIFTAPL